MGSLASTIRAKHPGVYDDLSDEELSSRVLEKYPEYGDLATPAEKVKPLGPKIGPREKPTSLIDRARDYVANLASERRIGAEEREEAKTAGIGLTMTPGELAMSAAAPALPVAAAAALPATLAGMLAGQFGSMAGGKLGAEAAESFAPGAGSLGEEAGALAGGLVGGAAGAAAPGVIGRGAAAIRAATPGAAITNLGSMVRGAAPHVGDMALDLIPMGRTGKMLLNLAKAGWRASRSAAPTTAIEAAVPAVAEAAAPAVAEAAAAPVVAAEAAPVPAWVQKIAERAKANPLRPLAAPAVAETAAAEAAPALSPKAVFDQAFSQAVAAGKSIPEAATIARAARAQAATATGGQLAGSLGPVMAAPPTGINAASTPELAAIAERGNQFVPSRPPPPATPGWTPPLRNPAFLEQSALLAKMLGLGG